MLMGLMANLPIALAPGMGKLSMIELPLLLAFSFSHD
jgi:xanthine/uracil/vitamin C permease (AzgA family)